MVHLQALGAFVTSNILALLLCVFVYMAIGALWYGFLFMKAWSKLSGADTLTDEQKKKTMINGMATSIITGLVIAIVLGRGMQLLDMSSVAYPLVVATIFWLPFTALPMAQCAAHAHKPFKLLLIDSGYMLVSLWAMSLVLYATILS